MGERSKRGGYRNQKPPGGDHTAIGDARASLGPDRGNGPRCLMSENTRQTLALAYKISEPRLQLCLWGQSASTKGTLPRKADKYPPRG